MDRSQIFATVDTVAPGIGTGVFSLIHFSVLIFLGLIIYGIIRQFKLSDRATRDKIIAGVAVFAILNELLKDVYLAVLGQFSWANLPFHLCGINIIVIAIYLVTRKAHLAEWLYAMGLPGGLVALISPDWAELPVANIMFWQANTIHATLVLLPILLLIDGFRPHGKRFLKILPWFLGIAAVIYPLNKLLNTNFLFMNWAPIGTPFEMFEHRLGNPGYLIAFAALFGLCWFMMYLPWREKGQSIKEIA